MSACLQAQLSQLSQLPGTPVAAAHDWQLQVELRPASLAAVDPMEGVEQQQGQHQQQMQYQPQLQYQQQQQQMQWQQYPPQQYQQQEAEEEAGTPAYRTYSLFGSGSGGFGTGEEVG